MVIAIVIIALTSIAAVVEIRELPTQLQHQRARLRLHMDIGPGTRWHTMGRGGGDDQDDGRNDGGGLQTLAHCTHRTNLIASPPCWVSAICRLSIRISAILPYCAVCN